MTNFALGNFSNLWPNSQAKVAEGGDNNEAFRGETIIIKKNSLHAFSVMNTRVLYTNYTILRCTTSYYYSILHRSILYYILLLYTTLYYTVQLCTTENQFSNTLLGETIMYQFWLSLIHI